MTTVRRTGGNEVFWKTFAANGRFPMAAKPIGSSHVSEPGDHCRSALGKTRKPGCKVGLQAKHCVDDRAQALGRELATRRKNPVQVRPDADGNKVAKLAEQDRTLQGLNRPHVENDQPPARRVSFAAIGNMGDRVILKAGQNHERSAPAVVKSWNWFTRRGLLFAVESAATVVAEEDFAAVFRHSEYICSGRDHSASILCA
jgi:hypothetical protein